MALICDSGPLLGALDDTDPDHRKCRALLRDLSEDLLIPGLVLAEVDYWCHKRDLTKVWMTWLEELNDGAGIVDWPTTQDFDRALELQRMYTGVGLVDATVLASVERWNEDKLATLDQRHFRMMKPLHVEALRLLPEN